MEGGVPHSLYEGLLRCPPNGYRVFSGKTEKDEKPQAKAFSRKQIVGEFSQAMQRIYYGKLGYEAKTLSYMGLKTIQNLRPMKTSNVELLFAPQQLMFSRVPWVTDFEYANALVDYGDIRLCRRFIQKAIGSSSCKKIMPWSEWAKGTLLRSLNCSSFKEKIEVVHFGLQARDFTKNRDKSRIRLLFVGSINRFNYLNFEWKGGLEVIDAFLELNKRYDVELVVRSWVPPEVRDKCAGKPNIRIVNNVLSEKELTSLFSSSDIFLFPAHVNLGMALLEAMSYELPVVAFNLYDIPEAIQDMKTGILMEHPPNIPYHIWNGAPNHKDPSLLPRIRKSREWIINCVVDKTSLLIEDESLRRRIGQNARDLIDYGEFSLAKRNQKLKDVFDEATAIA